LSKAASKAESVVAVDLGFARSASSSGVAWRTPSSTGAERFTFGRSIHKVANLVQTVSEADLILEAPLSGLFSATGNPLERRELEFRPATEESKAEHRYWYVGAGAVTCLAALFFLRELEAVLSGIRPGGWRGGINLYEGFVSFKHNPSPDEEDAARLLNGFIHGSAELVTLAVPTGARVVSLLDLLEPKGSTSAPPAIVLVR
jgi:hypothetical protein